MIDVFDIEKRAYDLLHKYDMDDYTEQDFMDAFKEANEECTQWKKMCDALTSSVIKNLSEEQSKKIFDDANKMIEEYDYRYTPEEDRKILNEYGYTHPIYYISDGVIGAEAFMDNGTPVYLLYNDNTSERATSIEAVEKHIANGGLVGAAPYAVEELERIVGKD